MILEQLVANPPGFWLSFGGILLVAELLGACGYLLWSGVAAVIVSLVAWLFPASSWQWQWVIFAVMTAITALLWWYWINNRPLRLLPPLNQRNKQLLGLHTTLTEPIVNGFGRMQVADGNWRIACKSDLSIGSKVIVVAVDGITLIVEPITET